jgi:Bifunctional DNA primase/polymerase, N-terminal/Primase C terminal 1 (PriCT-1)
MPVHQNVNAEQTTAPLLRAALQLAERGLAVFPCRPQDKRPATAHGLKDATTDIDVIEHWWHRVPDFNIGVATGAISDILVVDVDNLDAETELRKLETQHCALPATVESITARGRHLFFRWPQRTVRNSASKLATGIDIRGDGGYVIVPPSLHPSGKRYCWSVDSANAFAAAPEWLLDKITEPQADAATTPTTVWRDLIHDGVAEGCRNDAITRVVGHLLRRHVDPLITLELAIAFNDARCRPPLTPDEVVAITDSIAALELRRRLNQ